MTIDLHQWYNNRRPEKGSKTRPVTEVGCLTVGMIGEPDSPNMGTKGDETKGMMYYAMDLLR
eukprot:7569755-Pyramimonas_sp.AAC.1